MALRPNLLSRLLLPALTAACPAWAEPAPAAGQGAPRGTLVSRNQMVAMVNGDVITLVDVLRLMPEEKPEAVSDQDWIRYRLMKFQSLVNELIELKLLSQGAAAENIGVTEEGTDRAMEKEIQDTFGTKERFQRYLSVMKLSAKEYREFVRQKLMARALVQRRTQADSPVASRELVEYYEAHKSEFMEGGACELWGIYVPKTWQRAESPVTLIRSLAEELKQAPKEFEAKAKAHSVGPGAAEGGYWGWKDLKSLSEPLRRACETLTKDGISGVIETEAGYFVLKMGESKPGQLQSFESAQTAIQEKIVRQRFSDQRKKLIQDLKDKGYVFVTKSMDDHWLR